MHAVALEKYGSLDYLKQMELPIPVPAPGEVQIRVHASALNPADFKVALGTVKFLHARKFPMVLGYDFSGVIEAVNESPNWKVGDEVFGILPYGPFNRRGAFAEFLVASGDEIALKPASVSHLQAAGSATACLTALQGIRDSGNLPTAGSRVLITGVSGGVGSTAISVARKLGAEIVAIGSGGGLELAKILGAHQVVDRKRQNAFDSSLGLFDIVFDAAAAYRWSQCKGILKPGGRYVTTLPTVSFMIDKMVSIFSSTSVKMVTVRSRPKDLQFIASMLASGTQITMDSVLPVRDVAKGLEKLQSQKVLGRIVINVDFKSPS